MIKVLVADDDPMVRRHLQMILTSAGEIEVVEEVLRTAPGGVLIDIRMPGVLGLVKVAAQGHTVLSPAAARHLVSRVRSDDHIRAAQENAGALSERERDVLGCLGEGLTNGEIAARLFLPETTVKSYVSRLLDKLGLAKRTQAGLPAHQARLALRRTS
ncbi:DNA-binding response regulator, NarL/FixJ family, contains REC and HTH domains [Nonomuraea solani]|uniref:DNA-binding response regulator, NarL/FixJ family, contains REC and HTH domains n=1 Tax=Nonomuraea solani TaxID=1144553 RepID=A0A1H6BJ29_9ACTN|nr:response regulator transcription factor [Nonomuraea solani]SEG60720.1 DNA-binding response regulator, NarL/FixJ family, contains REC and HTH domains [Nonomuraea solani]